MTRRAFIAAIALLAHVGKVIAEPVKMVYRAAVGHTHTCAAGHTWDHVLNPTHTCQVCGREQYWKDQPARAVPVPIKGIRHNPLGHNPLGE